MIPRISGAVHEWAGWCPNAQSAAYGHSNRSDVLTTVPARDGVLPARRSGWLQRFRNWILVQALFYTAIISLFLPLLITREYLVFIIAGMVAATLAFFVSANRLWRKYNSVLAREYLEESGTKRNLVLYLVVSVWLLLICFEILVFLGYIPGIDFLVLPAFMVGLSVIPWYVLLLVIIWESRTGCRLYFDRTKGDVSMYVLRGD
jgi:hypothetical protein